jgi:polyisoprenoid-binding protein YceI
MTVGLTATAFSKTVIPAGKYEIDASHSKVGFEVNHLVISTVDGKFNAYTTNFEVAEKFENSKIIVEFDMNSIDTGMAKRDEHLKSAEFFDVSKFPKMTFQSKSFSIKNKDLSVAGDLTIRDVTKPVVLKGRYAGSVKDAWGNEVFAAQLNAKIKRKDFGLTWNKLAEAGPVVGDEVTIKLNVEAKKQK